ncbi:UDP-N-acetylglucosamine transferase subunit ALG13 [Mycena chlorophos]|uniref:UDP-N-acetylglucosamine transferase subunit ALG13 n=1 Tax=Mycena chlorophos TaxID=658473 RepID=A0A8H6TT58_MYCCL|nr:UDP-N-acetylglucosamine transferase subunit ALG13 [Mycena chlorophos]
MLVFVTVGTFQFDALVDAVLDPALLKALRNKGYTRLVVQYGLYKEPNAPTEREGVQIELWPAKPSLSADFERADLVIGHAGAGTILEVLRLGKPLIVVPNPTLLHNHQTELANALGEYLSTSSVADLVATVDAFDAANLTKFPAFDGTLLDSPSPSMAPAVTMTSVDASPDVYEQDNVHSVYDEIASHFSQTRYKPWPIIAAFLQSIHPTWIGLDSGTGNGKYLPLCCPWTIGLDRSRNLLEIARTAGGAVREVVQGDVLDNSWRTGVFDYAISIATIHHLATPERRRRAIQQLLNAVSPHHGRVLIYVWATRQDEQSKRSVPITDASNGQDVFVPWVSQKDQTRVFNRYYHMFADGELDALVVSAAQEMGLHVGAGASEGVEIVQQGWERSNHFVELRRYKR